MNETVYELSDKKRVIVSEKNVEVQIYRAGYSYPSGAYCGHRWYKDYMFTKEEFEKLKKILDN